MCKNKGKFIVFEKLDWNLQYHFLGHYLTLKQSIEINLRTEFTTRRNFVI
jgi:hypothetical protein